MQGTTTRGRKPSWILIPVRALLVTFLLMLLSFALSLLLAILGLVMVSRARGTHPDMTLAYRYVAAPIAVATGAIVLAFSLGMEIRHYRQVKALASIERAG